MLNENKSLSDLLDDQCSSEDLNSLLKDTETVNKWYRYQSVSAILKNEYAAHASVDFCRSISSKIADEPAILVTSRQSHVSQTSEAFGASNSSTVTKIKEVKRVGGGLAIAASVALATFFSVQTLQVSQLSPTEQQAIAAETVDSDDTVVASEIDSLEQTELEAFNGLFLEKARRSEYGTFAPVRGEHVRTIRFSAEQWQQMLRDAARQQAEKKAAEEEKAKIEVLDDNLN